MLVSIVSWRLQLKLDVGNMSPRVPLVDPYLGTHSKLVRLIAPDLNFHRWHDQPNQLAATYTEDYLELLP